MINADEHKKLLEQVAELERNSVNYFDVEKEFFLIDSENLAEVKTHFYGYSIQANGIYEQDNLTPEAVANLDDGRGCYVYVEARGRQITIRQDLSGCWGIYLFRHGDYFAISNSFFRLVDHVKFKYPLTVNRDYCNYLFINFVASNAYLETAVNEIQSVARNALLRIDVTRKTLYIEMIDYHEHTIHLDSAEGIAILDYWIEFWSNVLRGIAQHTKFISMDLSGGFDSRIGLLAVLNSGIDLNTVRIRSFTDNLHTHSEDYAIASQIASHYKFALNRSLPDQQFLNYSLADSFNADLYHQQTFRNLPEVYRTRKNVDKIYCIKGLGGETIQGYWHMTPNEFLKRESRKVNLYPRTASRKLLDSVSMILNSGFRFVRDKYKIAEEDSADIPQYFYIERYRNHHGKEAVGDCLKNIISLSPTLDPNIRTVKLSTAECPDPKLLIALIFTRYAPDLLKFPFEGKRVIAPETIEHARKINEQFPRRVNNTQIEGGVFHLQTRDLQAEKILAEGKNNNPNIPSNLPEACLKAVFESGKTFGLFTKYFDEELYRYAADYYDTHVFGRSRPMYAIIGVAKVLEDVEISQRNHTHTPYRDMQRFLEEDFCQIRNDKQIASKFKPYITARIDLKLIPKDKGDFQIISISDDRAKATTPEWFQKDGIGYVILSYDGYLEITTKATVDGQVQLRLKGIDFRNPQDKSKRIPYWIDYTNFTINKKTIFNELTPAWHDKPYRYDMEVKANEEIKIKVEWLPHRSDT